MRQREAKRHGLTVDASAPAAGNAHAGRTQRILLIIGGGIAAYKALDLIRRLKEHSLAVRCILTKAAQEFITPLSAGALSASARSRICSIPTANSTPATSGCT